MEQIFAYVQIVDAEGNEDFSDGIISNNPMLLTVTQKNVAPEFILNQITSVLDMEFTARGADVTINSIKFTKESGAILIDLPFPIKIDKDTTKNQSKCN